VNSFFRKPTLGLALGGGGARGLAHIGVLKVLCSKNISIDYLAGTSMGAIIAALYASKIPLDSLETEARSLGKLNKIARWVDRSIMGLDFIINGENIQEYFSKIIGKNMTFESLHIPLALASVDMKTGREVVIQTGSLVEGMHASMALPGIIKPLTRDGMLLVDGGSLNNVPADLVRSMGAEVVMAVNVSPAVTDAEYWEKQKLPGIAAANWRSNAIMVASITTAKLRRAKTDLVICPVLNDTVGTLSGFKYADEIITAGAAATCAVLPQLQELLKPRFFFSHPQKKPALSIEL